MSHIIKKDKRFKFIKESKIPLYLFEGKEYKVKSVEYYYKIEKTDDKGKKKYYDQIDIIFDYNNKHIKHELIEDLPESNYQNKGTIFYVKYDYNNLEPLKITKYIDSKDDEKKSAYDYIYPKEKPNFERIPSPKRSYDESSYYSQKNSRRKKMKIKRAKSEPNYTSKREERNAKNGIKTDIVIESKKGYIKRKLKNK